MQPFAFLVESKNLEIVVEVVIGKQEVGQVILERFGGERMNVGILDHAFFIRQVGHAVFFAAAHWASYKQRLQSCWIHPQACLRSKLPQGTDFIVA